MNVEILGLQQNYDLADGQRTTTVLVRLPSGETLLLVAPADGSDDVLARACTEAISRSETKVGEDLVPSYPPTSTTEVDWEFADDDVIPPEVKSLLRMHRVPRDLPLEQLVAAINQLTAAPSEEEEEEVEEPPPPPPPPSTRPMRIKPPETPLRPLVTALNRPPVYQESDDGVQAL